jgi:hypothetical protein
MQAFLDEKVATETDNTRLYRLGATGHRQNNAGF